MSALRCTTLESFALQMNKVGLSNPLAYPYDRTRRCPKCANFSQLARSLQFGSSVHVMPTQLSACQPRRSKRQWSVSTGILPTHAMKDQNAHGALFCSRRNSSHILPPRHNQIGIPYMDAMGMDLWKIGIFES